MLKRGAEIYEKLVAEKPDSYDYNAELAELHRWWFFGNLLLAGSRTQSGRTAGPSSY